MKPEDMDEFIKYIAGLYGFYRQDYSDFCAMVWWRAMQQYELDEVVDALNRHCINPDTGQFMPKPADVVKMMQGSTQDSGLIAWSKVESAIKRVGVWPTVVFDDPLIHRVISDMEGWVQLGMKTDKDWPFVKNEFVTRYKGYKIRNEMPKYPKTLIGVAEAANVMNGYKAAAPLLLGDQEKANRTMLLGSTGVQMEINAAQEGDLYIALEGPSQEE